MVKDFDFYAHAKQITLPNGLTVVAAHRPKAQWEELLFCVRSGAKDDPVGMEGLAHLMEHQIMNEGTFSSQEFSDFFDDFGGDIETGATSMFTTYWRFMLPMVRCTQGVDVFSRFFFDPKWVKENDFLRERDIVIQEYKRGNLSSYRENITKLRTLLFPNWVTARHLFGPIGFLDYISSAKLEDIAHFHEKHYRPGNFIVFADGGISLNKLADLFRNSRFGISTGDDWTNPLIVPVSVCSKPKLRMVEYSKADWGYPVSNRWEVSINCNVPSGIDVGKTVLRQAISRFAFKFLREEKNLIYSSSQTFQSDFPMADLFGFTVELDRHSDIMYVRQMWSDFLAWLETSEFDVFCQQKKHNRIEHEKYPEYYKNSETSLVNACRSYVQAIPFSQLTNAAGLSRWENFEAEQARRYIPYLKEYAMVIGQI